VPIEPASGRFRGAGAAGSPPDAAAVVGSAVGSLESDEPAGLEEIAVDAAVAAAELIRHRLGETQTVETKSSPTDVVTAADVEVETFIRGRLLAATPGAAIRGEERAPIPGTTSIGWIIDPIDGTVNFLYDLPVMSVSIAATMDGEVVAGAVVDVVRGEVFSGSVGNGVRRDGVLVKPSSTAKLSDALIGTGFSYSAEVRRREGAVVARVLPEARDIRCFGSAALHLCWVACGRLEAFYQEGLMEWDVAAGAFLAAQAGARVEPGSAANNGTTLAASPAVFDPLRDLILG
jgi:myo-inositol-1(or 4)-monophosphatase